MNEIEVKMKAQITYYGGKKRMLKIILPMIPEHDIYVEPFFGGGAVFWAKEPANVEFVNDKNGEVANFYRVLQNDFDALKKQIDSTLHSEFMHKEARSIYFSPEGMIRSCERGPCGCSLTSRFTAS